MAPVDLQSDPRRQGTLRRAGNVFCTDRADGAATPFGNDRGLARFRVLARLSLRHAHVGCLGAAGLLCPWLPASLQVNRVPDPTDTQTSILYAILTILLPRYWIRPRP